MTVIWLWFVWMMLITICSSCHVSKPHHETTDISSSAYAQSNSNEATINQCIVWKAYLSFSIVVFIQLKIKDRGIMGLGILGDSKKSLHQKIARIISPEAIKQLVEQIIALHPQSSCNIDAIYDSVSCTHTAVDITPYDIYQSQIPYAWLNIITETTWNDHTATNFAKFLQKEYVKQHGSTTMQILSVAGGASSHLDRSMWLRFPLRFGACMLYTHQSTLDDIFPISSYLP